jgi:dihydrofolate reductase
LRSIGVRIMTIKCSVYCGASLDGFIARPDGDMEWLHRPEYAAAEAPGLTYDEFIASVDAVAMGRRTFEKVLTFRRWPYDVPVVVLSTSLRDLPGQLRSKATLMAGPPGEIVRELANLGRRHLYVDGGNTIQRFLGARLIHEITVTCLPVLLGAGIPLFGSIGVETPLKLVQVTSSSNGFVQVRYRVEHAARKPFPPTPSRDAAELY